MPSYIVHREGAYNVFSTISDTFAFEPACSLAELEEWYQANFGSSGMEALPARLERARATGSSGFPPFDGIEWMTETCCQGNGGEPLSYDECVRRFLTLSDNTPNSK